MIGLETAKLDEILRLSRKRDDEITALRQQMSDLSEQVTNMAPVVHQVADAITFAKVGRAVFRSFSFLIGIGLATAPVLWWMADRRLIFWQLFKRLP